MGLQEDFLALYGLTSTTENVCLIDSLVGETFSQSAIDTLCHLLEVKAAGEERKAPFEVLCEGIFGDEDPYDVFAKMGLPSHDYYEYLYSIGREHPELLLELYNEMCRAEEYLSEVYLLKDQFSKLEGKNLQFLRGYLSVEDVTAE